MKPDTSPKKHDILDILKEMESVRAEYPEELFSARLTAFLDQVAQYDSVEAEAEISSQDQKVVDLFRGLKSVRESYPPRLRAARRAAYMRRISWINFTTLWDAVRRRVTFPVIPPRLPSLRGISASLMVASLAFAVIVGFLLYENYDPFEGIPGSQQGIVRSGRIMIRDTREARIICKPGFLPPLCLAGTNEKHDSLTYPGNGKARPAVAKDTLPAKGNIHRASYVNDGLYGPGASWVSNSKNSWIKIDLGKAARINTITFGRDRLGEFNDGDPGQFIIAVALNDNVYANGNSSNDDHEYLPVYNSEETGFQGTIAGPETVTAQFDTHVARYIKITFENMGTAVDEVEAFMVQPPVAGMSPIPKERQPGSPPTSMASSTPLPTFTAPSLPTDTPTPVPTDTPLPTDTATSAPTHTQIPTDTPTPLPTNTPIPPDTATPAPTHTPVPIDTEPPSVTGVPPPSERPLNPLDDMNPVRIIH